jgi:HAD superfamily hydrolase (TIGR01549 family)
MKHARDHRNTRACKYAGTCPVNDTSRKACDLRYVLCGVSAFVDPAENTMMDESVDRHGRKPVLGRRRPPRSKDTNPIPLWICDVNGVLIDSAVVISEAFAATCARYHRPFSEREFDAIKGKGLLDAYRTLDPGGDPYVRRAFHVAYQRERVTELQAFPGVRETLAAGHAAGVRIGATTSYGEIAEACLVHTGLYAFVDYLVAQDDVMRPKPHPESIQRILALWNIEPHESALNAFHIGDTVTDIEAGRAAGIHTIGVTYGMSREAEIRSAEPDYVIESFPEMRFVGYDADLPRASQLRDHEFSSADRTGNIHGDS